MKSADNINNLFKNSEITVGSEVDKKILNKAASALPRKAIQSDRNIWSIIMHNKIIKPVAAAIIIAVLAGIYQLTGSIDGASVAWADVIHTMKQQDWIYMYHDNGSNISQWWICPEEKICIDDYNGNVTYKDFKSDISYFYDKERNEIEERLTVKSPHDVTFEDEQQMKEIFNRPYQELEQVRRYINPKTTPEICQGIYRGHDVRIFKYKSHDEKLNIGDDGNWLIIYLDAECELLRGYVMWSHTSVGPDPKTAKYAGVKRGESAFDYPDPGPQNIYDVGVPKDAKVIDRYDEKFIELLPIYNQHKKEGLNRIACIITSYDTNMPEVVTKVEMLRNPDGPISKLKEPLGGVAMMFDVFYIDGVKVRQEHRFNLMDKLGSKNLIQYWPKCREELGSSYESQLAWLRDRDDATFSSIVIDDGKDKYRFSDSFGLKKRTSEEWSASRYGLISQCTWPDLDVRCEIIKDKDAEIKGLICVKYIQKTKGHSTDDIFLYYLNPSKNYLCHKKVIKWGRGSKQVHEIEEYQQVNGRWYPKKIRYGSQKSSDKKIEYDDYKMFFIDERCDFSDDLFNISYVEKLSKQRKKSVFKSLTWIAK